LKEGMRRMEDWRTLTSRFQGLLSGFKVDFNIPHSMFFKS
jgi:hypothetical protein